MKMMSQTEKPAFCNCVIWNQKLEYLTRSLLSYLLSKDTKDLYTQFRECYDKDESKREILVNKEISIDMIPAFSYIKEVGITNINHVGIDFPTYFNYEEGRPVVMIVGIDPLRSGDDLKNTISVGTPYALHSK